MLVDDVTITITAGKGGDGSSSLKRNAQTRKGGPDGGNGGNGGSIFFAGSHNVSDLREFRFTKKIKAQDGTSGKKNNLFGKNGEDITVKVPLETVITDSATGEQYEVSNENPLLLAKGGKGGRGNREFRTATNQTPRYAEKGLKGEEKIIRLELRLIADIGLIGIPNAGKSSLLKVLTNADPKIGNYPFTTTEPNLGVMKGIVIADIPGLIEGASKGKGLGLTFLKHIEKTRLLLHCIDVNEEDPLRTYKTIRQEFEAYGRDITHKNEIIILTKIDTVDEKSLQKSITALKKTGKKIFSVSIHYLKTLQELQDKIIKRM